jgi:hypothetical protein
VVLATVVLLSCGGELLGDEEIAEGHGDQGDSDGPLPDVVDIDHLGGTALSEVESPVSEVCATGLTSLGGRRQLPLSCPIFAVGDATRPLGRDGRTHERKVQDESAWMTRREIMYFYCI